MKKQQCNMPNDGLSRNNQKKQIDLLRTQPHSTPLSPLRYLRIVGVLTWAYAVPVTAANECGDHTGPAAITCAGTDYPTGITYFPAASLTLEVGPGATIDTTAQSSTYSGINIYHANNTQADLTVTLTGTGISTESDGSNEFGDGIVLQHGGSGDLSIVANDVHISTTRTLSPSYAVSSGITAWLINNDSSGNISIETTGGTISTTGRNSYGLYALHGGQEGNISVNTSSQITTSNELAHGVSVYRESPTSTGDIHVQHSGGTVTTSGNKSEGISITNEGFGNTQVISGGTIATTGSEAAGIFVANDNAANNGMVTIQGNAGSSIGTTGTMSNGVNVLVMNGDVNMLLSETAISTQGTNAVGLQARPLASGAPSSATITSGLITTRGDLAHGIVAGINSLGPDTDVFNTSGVQTTKTIDVTGMGSIGVATVSTTDTLIIADANITATGEFGAGIMASSTDGVSAVTISPNVTITGGWQDSLTGTSGQRFDSPSVAIVLGGTTATLTNNGNVGALSDRTVAAAQVFTPISSAITLENHGTITGYLSLAGAGPATFNNHSSHSFVMRHFADTNGDGIRDTKRVAKSDFGGTDSVFNNQAQGLVRFGEVTANTLADLSGQYVPTTGIDRRPLEADFYTIDRPGIVQGQLVNLATFNHAGTIDLRGPAVGNVLLITGNPDMATPMAGSPTRGVFVSNGGQLISNVALNEGIAPAGQSNSYADMLVVDSTQVGTGATNVTVINQGGLGGITAGNGIELIEVRDKTAGASASGAFALTTPVAAGAYSYQLHQHGTGSDAGDGNWYLRTSIPDPDLEPTPDPEPDPGPTPTPSPSPAPNPDKPLTTYRPQVPVYMATPALASRIGLDMLGTYHDRLGEDFYHTTKAGTMARDAGWARIYGGNLKTKLNGNAAGRLDQFERYGPAYTLNTFGFQAGKDLYRRSNRNHSDVAGAYLGYSHGKANVQNVLDDNHAGSVKMDAYSLGGYWTRKGDSSWYMDGVLQATYYGSIKAQSQGQRLSTHGWGLAASAEAGYPFDAGAGWKLEPQAQLIYQYLKLKDASDDFGQIRYSNQGALHGRIGARLAKTFTTADDRQFTPWLRANLWFSPERQATTTFSTTTGNHPTALNTNLGSTWAQWGVGVSGELKKNVSMFASADYNHNIGSQKAHGVTGRIGIKVAW